MIRATVEAEAKVNFGAFEWCTIAGNSRHISMVDDAIRSHGGELPWGKQFATRVVQLPGEVIIIAGDRIANVPGHDPFWAIERHDDGTLGTRACGVMLFYSMNEDEVRAQGLPHISQVKAAFLEDALAVLKAIYAAKTAGPALTREFPPHSFAHEGEWEAALRDIRKGRRRGGGKPPIEEGFGSKKNSEQQGSDRRKLMIGAGVILGIVLTGLLTSRLVRGASLKKSR
jgi:hypothetical protein